MEKKKYVVPNMIVVELRHQTRLLAGSSGDPNSDKEGDESYIPNMDNDELNKLA